MAVEWADLSREEVPIPSYDALMLPVLKLCAGRQWMMRDLIRQIADDLHLTEEERTQLIPSGRAKLIDNRVHWAKTYLKHAGLLQQPQRARVEITALGRNVLNTSPAFVDVKFLKQFPGFQKFLAGTKGNTGYGIEVQPGNDVDPPTRPPKNKSHWHHRH